MKLVLQIAGGITLAIVAMYALGIALAVAPAFGGFLGAVVGARDFPVFLLILVLIVVVVAVALRRPRHG